MRLPFLLLCLSAALPVAAADCHQRDLLITRYHYPDPTDPSTRWRDILLLEAGENEVFTATRLSTGALNPSPYDNFSPQIAPGGERLLFLSNRGAGPHTSLYAMAARDEDLDLAGDGLGYVGLDDPELGGLHWPGGARLAYVSADAQGVAQVHLGAVAPDGSGVTASTALSRGGGPKADPRLSPRGTAVLYLEVLRDEGASLRDRLWLHPLDGGAPQALGEAAHDGLSADWMPEGDEIVLARADPALPDGPSDLWRIAVPQPAAAGDAPAPAQRLTTTPDLAEMAPAVSADGACLAYLAAAVPQQRPAEGDVMVLDLASGSSRRLTFTGDIHTVSFAGR